MFKRVEPRRVYEDGTTITFPHCDQRVLHAPGECQHCDMHPQWQELRQAWGICFTGYEPEAKELPCPADFARPGGLCQVWSGNKPT